VGGLKEKVLAAHQANIHHLIVPAENKKDMADIPVKIQRRIRFTFVETMDQVIEVALLSASHPEAASENQQEQALPEPRLLFLDERVAGNREQTPQRTGFPTDEEPEDDLDENNPSTLIIPPVDRIARDSYPNLRAKEADTQDS
jgi:ATP-dependent Lon protease